MIAGIDRYAQPALDEYRPGHLFWFPAGSTWMNLHKPRPFALATPCSPAVRGTLVYGSTQETEQKCGAACIEVAPRPDGVNRNGLRAPTYFYPGALFRTATPSCRGIPERWGSHYLLSVSRSGVRSESGRAPAWVLVHLAARAAAGSLS